jgi:hypothetical protein
MQEQARDAGSRVVGAARQRARSLFETQQHRAADQIEGVAQALHQAAQQLDQQNQGISSYVTSAADQVERLADTVRTRSLDDIIDQTERFARRQPELFVGGAMLLGLALGRFLRASSDRRAGWREEDWDRTGEEDLETGYYGGGYGTGGGLDEAGRRLQTRTSRVDDGPGSPARPRTRGRSASGGATPGSFAQGSTGGVEPAASQGTASQGTASMTAMGGSDSGTARTGRTGAGSPETKGPQPT